MTGGKFDAFCRRRAQHGLIHHAGIDALEPTIPPTKRLLQEADLRAGTRKMWIPVGPRPDETLTRYAQSLEQAWNCILVSIGPAADGVHGALDRRVILAHRSMLPITITSLVLQPRFEKQRHVLEALEPHRPPAIADQNRVGWQAHGAEQKRAPLE